MVVLLLLVVVVVLFKTLIFDCLTVLCFLFYHLMDGCRHVSGFAQLAEELGLPTTLSEVGVVDGKFRPQWQMLTQSSGKSSPTFHLSH